jgi:uncharacterized protein (TIGR03435 family)
LTIEDIVSHRIVNSRGQRKALVLVVAAITAFASPAVIGVVDATAGQVASGRTGAAQSADRTRPQFEVASVKLNTSGDLRRGLGPAPGGRFSAINAPLRELIAFAYGVPNARANLQIVGGPAWVDSERFNVEAVAPGGTIPQGQAGPMLREVLVDRFKLQVHQESREVPVYHLVMDRADNRLGSRLRPSTIDCAARRAARARGTPPPAQPGPAAEAPPRPPADPATIRPTCGLRQAPGRLAGDAVPMSQLVEALAPMAGRIIVDRTGLGGYFDIDLEWSVDARAPRPNDAPEVVVDRDAPGLFTAVREQLGLRIENARGPVDVVVIDAIERLTPD